MSSGRPANVVAQAVCAWPTRVAITCGCFMITSSRGSGSLSRIGAIRPRPMSAGGWCSETNAGLSSERQLLVEPGQLVRRELAVVDPLAVPRGDERVQHQDPEVRGLEHLDQRAGDDLHVEHAAGERLADVVVAGADQLGAGPGVEDGARLGVLLGQPVVGDVAGDEEYVGPRVEREQVRHDRLGARPGVGRPAEVGVADVRDEGDHPSPRKENACQRGPTGRDLDAAVLVVLVVLVVADDVDLQPRLREALGQPLAPLDDGDGLVEGGVEVEVVELGDAAEPVGVGVHQRRSPDLAGVHAGDDEGRRGDRAADAEPGAEPLGERRLAGAERAGEHDQVAGRELAGDGAAEAAHRLGVGRLEDGGAQRAAQLDVRRLPADLVEPLPLPEPDRVRQLLAGHDGEVVVALRGLHGRVDEGGRDAVTLLVGDDAEAAEVHRAAHRVEHERAGRGAVDAGEQAAVRGQPLLELLPGLGERGGRRVERRSRLERRVHDRVHGRRLLRADRLDLDDAPGPVTAGRPARRRRRAAGRGPR